jgi:hypothetical protein
MTALPILGFGQIVGDTIIVYVDNRVEIKVSIPDYNDLKSTEKVTSALREFQELIPEIENQLTSGTADLVKYSVGNSVTVEPGDPKYIYLIKDGEPSNTGFRDQGIISAEDFTIIITTSDISKIPDLSLSKCLEAVIAVLPDKSNWSKSLYFECIDEEVVELNDKNRINPPLDFLEFSLGAGVGLVKESWIPDLSFRVGLGFSRKGALSYNPYISTNFLFDFTTENKMNVNTFLNLGYRWNMDKKSEKPDMLGIEVGYLIGKQGDLFGDNTLKFGLNWSPLKNISVNPHIYITDDFKTVYPGVRIGFGF